MTGSLKAELDNLKQELGINDELSIEAQAAVSKRACSSILCKTAGWLATSYSYVYWRCL